MPLFKGEKIENAFDNSKKLQKMRLQKRNQYLHGNNKLNQNEEIEKDNNMKEFYESLNDKSDEVIDYSKPLKNENIPKPITGYDVIILIIEMIIVIFIGFYLIYLIIQSVYLLKVLLNNYRMIQFL